MSDEKRLSRLFRSLPSEQRQTLLAFAEFLASHAQAAQAVEAAAPAAIARPEEESVVKAIKRLMATYSMLDRGKLLHETSHHMTQHVMHGRPAVEVIDELEVVFARHYERYKSGE